MFKNTYISRYHTYSDRRGWSTMSNIIYFDTLWGFYRWKSKGTKPKGTGQKGPAKRDQPKGTKTQKGPWPKGTMAKRDQGTKGTMAKRDQGTKGTKGQKGPRHKRDHGLFKMLIIEIQIIGIPIFNH